MVAGLEDLPRNWLKVPLALITKEFISGGTPSTKRKDMWDGSIPWTTSASIDEDAVVLEEGQRLITERALADSATNLVPTGNLLIGTRVGVGKAVVNLVDIAISQDLTGLVVDHHIVDPVFVAYQFKTERIKEFFLTRIRGTTIKGISRFDLQSLELLLPPIDEQRAIVSCLDQVRAAIRTRRRELALERERKAALMDYLFTHGTRGEPTKQTEIGEMPESWQVLRLGELIERPCYGYTARAVPKPVGPKLLRITDIQDSTVDWDSVPYCEAGSDGLEPFRLCPGDIVVARIGATTGKAFLIEDCPDSIFASYLIRIRVKERVLPEFLFYFMETGIYWRQIDQKKGGRLKGGVNIPVLESLLFTLPTIEEQGAIIGVLEQCDAKIRSLSAEVDVLEELMAALIEDLMTGRIVVPGS